MTTPFRTLVTNLVCRIKAEDLRKLDDYTYKEVEIVETGERTHAWKPHMGIREFVYTHIEKEAEWAYLGEAAVAYLIDAPECDFPTLKVNRYVWAYSNGLYNVKDDMFWPFRTIRIKELADVHPKVIAAHAELTVINPSVVEELAETVSASVNGVNVYNLDSEHRMRTDTIFYIVADGTYHINFHGRETWPQLAARIDTFRRGVHVDRCTDVTPEAVRHCPTGSFSMDAATNGVIVNNVKIWNTGEAGRLRPDTVFQIVGEDEFRINANGCKPWRRPTDADDTPYACEIPSSADAAVKFFEQPFRFEITPEAERTFDPLAIRLPEMETIMEAQGLDADAQRWMLVMLCRLFFPVGFDRWEVAPLIRGIARSGKSTVAQIIRSFYPSQQVTTLAGNIESKFGLSEIYKGLVCISEVHGYFDLRERDLSGILHKWDTPMLMIGDHWVPVVDVGRIFGIDFTKKVRNRDPRLFDKFLENIDLFQRKGVALYHEMLHTFGDLDDIWAPEVVGPQLRMFRKESNDLQNFVRNKFEFNASKYMPINLFVMQYLAWRKCVGLPPMLTRYYMSSSFEVMGLAVDFSTKVWQGSRLTANFLLGIVRVPPWKQLRRAVRARAIVLYWEELTKHQMQPGGTAHARDCATWTDMMEL